MRRYAIILKRRQRNTITLRQLFNEWLPIHSQSISRSAVNSYHIAFTHIQHSGYIYHGYSFSAPSKCD